MQTQKKPIVVTAAGNREAILAKMMESAPLAGRFQTARFGGTGGVIAFARDGNPLLADIDTAQIGHTDGSAIAAILKLDDRTVLVAIPADLEITDKNGISMLVEAFADPRVNVTDEVLNYDHVLDGELQATRLVQFSLDNGNVTEIADMNIHGEDVIAALRKSDKVLLLAEDGIYDRADMDKPLVAFDNATGTPTTIIDGETEDTVNVYFYTDDGDFTAATCNLSTGELTENGETYPTPAVRRTMDGTTVWTRPINDPTTARGWGCSPATA